MPVEPAGPFTPHATPADADVTDAHAPGEGGAAIAGPQPPAAPRQLTGRAARGSWTEPRVRFWWLTAAVILAVGGWLMASGFLAWRREVWLVEKGLPVEAEVWEAHHERIPNRPLTRIQEVTLEYTVNGTKYSVNGYRKGDAREVYTGPEHKLPIKVDPDNPRRWTDRTDPPAMTRDILPGLLVLPIVPFLAVGAWAARRRVLRTWRDGRAVPAVVLERRQTPLAPRSRLVRCAPADPDGKLVLTVYLPPRAADAQVGEVIWVVVPDARSSRAVAAAWMM